MNKEEEIRSSIDKMNPEILKDTLSILLSSNVSKNNQNPETSVAQYKNFAQLILDMKKQYNFHELDLFSTEADLVYIQAGDRRILLTNADENLGNDSLSKNQGTDSPSPDEAFENIRNADNRFSRLEL